MPDFHIPLLPNEQYHIVGRAIGAEKIFKHEYNYPFFLSRYQKYISPIADTYSYCLLPNHFHLLIRIKEEKYIQQQFEKKKNSREFLPELAPVFVMQQFSNFLNSYTKSFNKMYHRKGGLFIDYLRRVQIISDRQFGATVFYIHKNPVHHGYCQRLDQWTWSSYNTMLSTKPTMLLRDDVLNWFGGITGFKEYHRLPVHLKNEVFDE